MNSRVESLLEQSRDFNELMLDDPQVTRGEPLLTSIVSGQTFNTVSGRIWECLVVAKVPIIGIYGMGGVGKTTLAMHIHNSVLEQTEDRAYWVGVSQREVSIEMLQDNIARAIGLTLWYGTDEREKRAAELNRALKRRAGFVLILDGLCNNIDLERAGYPFDVEGCQLIVTSRALEVCRRVGCRENFKLESLGEDDAWNLFKEKIFGQDDGTRTFAPQVEEIAKSMVETCGGLPQGIVEMARQMKGLTEPHEWRNALAQLEEQGVFRGDD